MAGNRSTQYAQFTSPVIEQQHTQTTLLQMHLQIEAVRDVLLQQAAQHHETVMAKLAALEASLQSITSGAIPIRVEGLVRLAEATQNLSAPPQPQAAGQSMMRRSPEPAAHPSPPPSRSNQLSDVPHNNEDDGVPRYELYNARTVDEIWREYKEGINGGPAIEQLERDHQARWRPSGQQRTAWCRRKVIVEEIIHLINSGMAAEEAIADLEAQRGNLSMTKLRDQLAIQQKTRYQRPVTGGRGRRPTGHAMPNV